MASNITNLGTSDRSFLIVPSEKYMQTYGTHHERKRKDHTNKNGLGRVHLPWAQRKVDNLKDALQSVTQAPMSKQATFIHHVVLI